MKIIHYGEAAPQRFEGDAVRGVTGRVAIGAEDGADRFCMRVFELAASGYTPKHSHEWEHEIFVHQGAGEVFRDGGWVPVGPGHVVFIPGGERHQIRNAGAGPFVFACLIPAGAPEL